MPIGKGQAADNVRRVSFPAGYGQTVSEPEYEAPEPYEPPRPVAPPAAPGRVHEEIPEWALEQEAQTQSQAPAQKLTNEQIAELWQQQHPGVAGLRVLPPTRGPVHAALRAIFTPKKKVRVAGQEVIWQGWGINKLGEFHWHDAFRQAIIRGFLAFAVPASFGLFIAGAPFALTTPVLVMGPWAIRKGVRQVRGVNKDINNNIREVLHGPATKDESAEPQVSTPGAPDVHIDAQLSEAWKAYASVDLNAVAVRRALGAMRDAAARGDLSQVQAIQKTIAQAPPGVADIPLVRSMRQTAALAARMTTAEQMCQEIDICLHGQFGIGGIDRVIEERYEDNRAAQGARPVAPRPGPAANNSVDPAVQGIYAAPEFHDHGSPEMEV